MISLRKTIGRTILLVTALGCAAGLSPLAASPATAAGKKLTVAYIAPSLDISYWQWVGYGVEKKAAELGMNYISFTSENSPGTQMNNIRTAVTRGVDAI